MQNFLFCLFCNFKELVLWQMENSLFFFLLCLLENLAVVAESIKRTSESCFKVFRLLKVLLVYVIVRKIHSVKRIFLILLIFHHTCSLVLFIFKLAVKVGSKIGTLNEILIGVNLALCDLLLRRQAARNSQGL
jgi:hypothetical protein